MKELVIELEDGWVLSHRDDNELPVDVLKNIVANIHGVEIKNSSLTTLTLRFDEKETELSNIKDYVMRLFTDIYVEADVDGVVVFSAEDVSVEEKQDDDTPDLKVVREMNDEEKREFQERISRVWEEGEERERSSQDKKSDTTPAIDKINALVGVSEFKILAQEIAGIADSIKATNTHNVFTNQCYLFSIGDGYGLTTYLELFARLIAENKLCGIASNPTKEVRLGEYRENPDPFETAKNAVENGDAKKLKVICVDISEWMNKTESKHFKQFLRTVEKHATEHIMVFRVPFVDKDILARIKYSLSDLLTVRSVSFPPFSCDELKKCAEIELKNYDFTMTKAAWECFFNRISEEKGDGKFYGINTVKKVVRELVYQKHVANMKKNSKSKNITVNDARALCFGDDGDLSGAEQLNKLVGVDGIKERIKEIVAQIELSLKGNANDRPCIHMRFVGNPGTGKTTVARIIGKLLKEKGILRVGAFFEYSGRDLCGRYVGETAPKTTGICRDAYGSVLFIDEAYSLYRDIGHDGDYGKEALDTLIAEMENHRNDFVVIMAGYNDDMDKLMKGNLGLASRMPYKIEFPNFTREQLYDIFASMANAKFKCDKAMLDAAKEYFDKLPEETLTAKEFSNARFVRNLFERTWAKAAMRCQLNDKADVTLMREDFEHASADKEFIVNIPKKTRIGF